MNDSRMSISSRKSFRRSTGNFLAGLASNDELEKLLECPICQDLPLPPIFTCQTGHIICNKCKIQLDECPLCKLSYTSSRNFPLESIVLTSTYYCSNRDKGCDVTGNSQLLENHHEKCIFRPTKCYMAGLDGCKGELLFLSEYLPHLTDKHLFKREPFAEGKLNVFKQTYNFPNWENVAWNKEPTYIWSNSWFKFDGKVFVSRTFCRGPKFFFQLATIAETTDEAKYSVKVTIEKDYDKLPKYELTTQVPSIREFDDNVKPNDVVEYGFVSKELLEALGHLVATRDDSKINLSWNVRYELSKIQFSPKVVDGIDEVDESLISLITESL